MVWDSFFVKKKTKNIENLKKDKDISFEWKLNEKKRGFSIENLYTFTLMNCISSPGKYIDLKSEFLDLFIENRTISLQKIYSSSRISVGLSWKIGISSQTELWLFSSHRKYVDLLMENQWIFC